MAATCEDLSSAATPETAESGANAVIEINESLQKNETESFPSSRDCLLVHQPVT